MLHIYIYMHGIMCYPNIPTNCVHLLATLLRVIFQWWGGPPWARRWGRVYFFLQRCKTCANRSPSKYHKTLQFDERELFLPATFFRRRASDLLMKTSTDPKLWNWRQKDRRFGGCWWDMKISWTIFDRFVLDFIRSSIFLKLESPNHGLLDMASPAAVSVVNLICVFSHDLHQFLGGSCNQVRWVFFCLPKCSVIGIIILNLSIRRWNRNPLISKIHHQLKAVNIWCQVVHRWQVLPMLRRRPNMRKIRRLWSATITKTEAITIATALTITLG